MLFSFDCPPVVRFLCQSDTLLLFLFEGLDMAIFCVHQCALINIDFFLMDGRNSIGHQLLYEWVVSSPSL